MEISANAFRSGLNGIQSGQRRADQAAADIASNTVNPAQQATQTPPQNQVNPSSQVASVAVPT